LAYQARANPSDRRCPRFDLVFHLGSFLAQIDTRWHSSGRSQERCRSFCARLDIFLGLLVSADLLKVLTFKLIYKANFHQINSTGVVVMPKSAKQLIVDLNVALAEHTDLGRETNKK
jgi:hypothetical protein